MPNAIIYTRVSTQEQADKGYSLRHQQDQLEKYCAIKNINIFAHFQDDHSAKTFERPEFKKLLQCAKLNKTQIDYLLFAKWDRFSRNATDALNMIRIFDKLGITIIAIEQPIDLSVPENKLVLSLYLTAPEVENDRRAMNTINGMRRAQKEGRCVSKAPYGYKNIRDEYSRSAIAQSTIAPLILKAFEEVALGIYNIEQVRKRLYKNGLKVSKSNFHTLIRNPFYYGKQRLKAYRDEPQQIIHGAHEPIISEALFYKVQNILDGKKKTKGNYSLINDKYPLRGHVVCSKCGKILTGSSSLGNGGVYHYYLCKNGCKETYLSK